MKYKQSIRTFFRRQLMVFSLAPVGLVVSLILIFFIREEFNQASRVAYWQARNVSIELKQALLRLESQLLKEADIQFLAKTVSQSGLAAETIRQLNKSVVNSTQLDGAIILNLKGEIKEAFPFQWYAHENALNFLSDFFHAEDINKSPAVFLLDQLDFNVPGLNEKPKIFAAQFKPSVLIVAPLVLDQNSFTHPQVVVGEIVYVVSLHSLVAGFSNANDIRSSASVMDIKFQEHSITDFTTNLESWLYVSETDAALSVLDTSGHVSPLSVTIHEPLANHLKTFTISLVIVLVIGAVFTFFVVILTRKMKDNIERPIAEIIADCESISSGTFRESQSAVEFKEFKIIKSALSKLNNTIQRQIENINVQKQRAESSEKAKSLFLANMSHEIRTPISGIIGMLHRVKKTQLTTEQARSIDLANSSAEALVTIINDILDFSKIESGKLTIEKAPFQIVQLLENAVEMFSHKAMEKHIELVLDVSRINMTYVEGDETRVRQILFNIIGNAVKFTEKGGVSVEADLVQTADGKLAFQCAVQDTGIGMTKEQCSKIFEDFVQADSATTRKFGGTGLGLSISKKLVEQMDGILELESQLHIGSRFTVTIPMLPVEVERQKELEKQKEYFSEESKQYIVESFRGKLVLLAEDNQVNQEIAQDLLRNLGINVICAGNGKMVIAALLTNKNVDLVLMDCLMPEMDGFETTQAIRNGAAGQNYRTIPIIALTANAFSEDRQKCLNYGMNAYLTKPIDESLLIKKLHRHLCSNNTESTPENKTSTAVPSNNSSVINELHGLNNDDNMRWDKSGALKRLGGKEERLKKIIKMFIEDTQNRIAALDESNWEVLDDVWQMAHTIKGTASAICANLLTEAVMELEKAAKQGEHLRVIDIRKKFIEEKNALIEILQHELDITTRHAN